MRKLSLILLSSILALGILSCSKQTAELPTDKKEAPADKEQPPADGGATPRQGGGIAVAASELVGAWAYQSYNNGISTYSRLDSLNPDAGGYVLKADGKVLYRGGVKGGCGVGAVNADYTGTWEVKDGVLYLHNIPFAMGKFVEEWTILTLSGNTITTKHYFRLLKQ